MDGKVYKALFSEHSATVILTNIVAPLLLAVLVVLAWRIAETDEAHRFDRDLNLMMIVAGILVGWILAVVWVPFDNIQQNTFGRIGAAVTAFVSGYALSKLDRLIEASLFDADAVREDVAFRVALLTAAVLLTAITVVTNRVEWLSAKALADAANKTLAEAANKAQGEAAEARSPVDTPAA